MRYRTITAACAAILLSAAACVAAASDAVSQWQADPTAPIDGQTVSLDDFKWIARPVLVFADTPNDPLFVRQMELLADRAGELALRDVVVIFDTSADTPSDLRLRVRPRGFMLALVGKDGAVKLRKPSPWDVRELSRSIDKMPLRQQEMQDRRGVRQ